MKKILFFAAVLAAIGAGLWFGLSLLSPATTQQRPDLRLPDMQGQMRSLSEWRGKVVVLNFWATWCPPCREEIPVFIELQKRHAGRLQIIGVAVDDLAPVRDFYINEGMNYPVLIDVRGAFDISADFGNTSGSLPYSVVLDAQGNIVARRLGALTQPVLEKILQPYLDAK